MIIGIMAGIEKSGIYYELEQYRVQHSLLGSGFEPGSIYTVVFIHLKEEVPVTNMKLGFLAKNIYKH